MREQFQNQTRVCIQLPPKVQSPGLWKHFVSQGQKSDDETFSWLEYSLPRLELLIALIFAITQSLHFILRRFGFPLVTSQLLAGLILSPAILTKGLAEDLMNDNSVQVLGSIGTFGFAFFLFLTGVQMDPSMVTRARKRALFIGLLAAAAPLICAALTLPAINLNKHDRLRTLFISPAYVQTTFPVISCLLNELKIINSELGRIGLSSAIISDLLGVFFMISSNIWRIYIEGDTHQALEDLGYVIGFVAFVFLIFGPAMRLIVRYTPEGRSVHQIFITAITLCFLYCVCVTRWFHQFILLPPYLLGLAIPHGPPLGSALVEKLESIVNNLLLPLYVTSCGMRVSTLAIKFDTNFAKANALIAVLVSLVKFGVCLSPPLCSKMPTKDSFALACIMTCKGVLDLAVFAFLFDNKIIEGESYSFMFFLILCVSSIVPILVRRLYDPSRKYAGYQKRNIIDTKPHAELQILACIHVPDNVRAVINLLNITCPTKDNPIALNVLHLVKLRGQASPVFISHQKRKIAPNECLYSENVIVSFNKFEGNNWGAVSVNTFTAVSPPNLMQDDICTLALDKLCCIIILPFHRRWYIDGSIESDDEGIRVLNTRVLEKAPCSVGILIDRGNTRRGTYDSSTDPSYNVAVIYLGGPDDREALTLGKRMAPDMRICLTVLHLMAGDQTNGGYEDWQDTAMLSDVKTDGYITYVGKQASDGSKTAMIVRSIVNEFDLIIVGRRENLESPQTSGLKEWSEFPELGVLGDLLASMDHGKSSILVVQQQQASC